MKKNFLFKFISYGISFTFAHCTVYMSCIYFLYIFLVFISCIYISCISFLYVVVVVYQCSISNVMYTGDIEALFVFDSPCVRLLETHSLLHGTNYCIYFLSEWIFFQHSFTLDSKIMKSNFKMSI